MWNDRKLEHEQFGAAPVLLLPRRQITELRMEKDCEPEAPRPFDLEGMENFIVSEVLSREETHNEVAVTGKDVILAIRSLGNSDGLQEGFTLLDLEILLPKSFSSASRNLVDAVEKLIELGVVSRDVSLMRGPAHYLLVPDTAIEQLLGVGAAPLAQEALDFAGLQIGSVVDSFDAENGLIFKPVTVLDYLMQRKAGTRIPQLLEDGGLLEGSPAIYGIHISLMERLEAQAACHGLVALSRDNPPKLIMHNDLL